MSKITQDWQCDPTPAFAAYQGYAEFGEERVHYYQGGMTLRDYFAAAALPAIMQSEGMLRAIRERAEREPEDMPAVAAQVAYGTADAMLRERGRERDE